MYKIDTNNNKLEELPKCSFKELGFTERKHLQEWIAKEPTVFGEELLIIQKEFSGFSDTNERLDLLALDKQGTLVIIEIKLDDTGRDVTWQALKYASYCSNMSEDNIKKIYQEYLDDLSENENAEERLLDFFEDSEHEVLNLNKGVTQRIILLAANFRKEVTSTVLWLLNYKIRLQCFRASPYSMQDSLFINFEQIIPTQEAEDYMIGMAEKAQDEIKSQSEGAAMKEFWTKLIQQMNQKSDLFKNISPKVNSWLTATSGIPGVAFNFSISNTNAHSFLYIDKGKGKKRENKFIFDELAKRKDQVHKEYDKSLNWKRMDSKQACRIGDQIPGSISEKEQWDKIMNFMVDSMVRLEKTFRTPLEEVNQKLADRPPETDKSD